MTTTYSTNLKAAHGRNELPDGLSTLSRLLLSVCAVLCTISSYAQDAGVYDRLKGRYDNVTYSSEGGGWYLVTYQAGTKTLMGFCDKNGTMVCNNVEKTEKHKSWINLCVLDAEKKAVHDRWEDDMRNYNRDMEYYNRVESQYDATLRNYNNQVSAAKNEANRRWQNARAIVERNARASQQTSSGGGLFGAIMQGVGNALAVQNAVNAVEYQPFEDQVMSERGLYSAPVKPDNPKPVMPTEPASGYEWKQFTYQQPCPFDEIDFEAIKTDYGHAIARKGSKYGVIDSNLDVNVPFDYDELKEKSNMYECRKDKLWGIVMLDGKEKFPCMFTALNMVTQNGRKILLTKINDKCGAADFETASAIIPNIYSLVGTRDLTNKDFCFVVKKDNLYGVCDENGKVILDTKYPTEFKFIHITGSRNYYIKAQTDSNVGLFDVKGKEIVPFDKCSKYEFIQNSFIKMYSPGGLQGVVGLDGSPIADLSYSDITWDENLSGFIATQYDKMGVISASGKLLFPMIQCEYLAFAGDYFTYKDGLKEKTYGALDFNGNVILEPKYALVKVIEKVSKLKKKDSTISVSYSNAYNTLTSSYSTASRKFVKE